AGTPHCCSISEPPPANITTAMAYMKKVIMMSTTTPSRGPQIRYKPSLNECDTETWLSSPTAMPSMVKHRPLTTPPSSPQYPKLLKNCNISCPDAKPAPTTTPTKAIAMPRIFFIFDMLSPPGDQSAAVFMF